VGLFENYRKRRAIKKIARKLPPYLRRSYGKSKQYSPGQVRTAMDQTGCNVTCIYFGYAMFCSVGDFNQVHADMGEQCDYEAMHQEVADICFSGDTNFGTSDLTSYSSDSGGGLFDSGFDGGGDGGGGGD
jgi:Family of unknown function (DUF6559)